MPQSAFPTQAQKLLSSSRYLAAKKELLASIAEASQGVRGIRGSTSSPEVTAAYQALIQDFNRNRGRDLYYSFLGAGLGAGPYVEALDGSVKMDLITGIGINFFGHTHPELMAEGIDALSADVMQGNLQPGHEAPELLSALLKRVGAGSRLKHGWLTTCGTMANEIALKIIRQKKFPATRIFAFEDCFSGRSTAMQEITDNPGYRQGQPTYGEVHHLPWGDAEAAVQQMETEMKRHPGKYAAIMIELVQGEGGFRYEHRDFYVQIFEAARRAGLAVWIDEIQTFGRTGELFAYQTFQLNDYPDVVTAAKMLQTAVVLYTHEFNPKPGLVAGTFSGSALQLRAARRTLEMLDQGMFGREGKIAKLSRKFTEGLEKLKSGECRGKFGEIRAIGGLISFVPLGGTQDEVKKVLMALFDLGVMAFYCGHGPFLIRMLPPLGAMTEEDIDLVLNRVSQALIKVGGAR